MNSSVKLFKLFIPSAIYLVFYHAFCYGRNVESDKDQCLLIILLDGIRWDYVNEENLKGFTRLSRNGVKAEYVRPVFPSNSYPNWYSIATGLYAESHGIVDNFIFDEKYNDYFLMAPDKGVFKEHWWNDAEPLWITAEKNSIKTYMYNWVGCEVPIQGLTASYCKNFRSLFSWWTRVNRDTKTAIFRILDHFHSNTSRLGFVYYEPIDALGHQFGPNSALTRNFLRNIDSILYDMQEEIEKRNLGNRVRDL
ncbi:ectonucleotide pyrophosphatase/phosphodiesterase family member 6-like [Centruroides sculpturatus]|uniref:ectonucleotide pyrophosphatase/phosphodiesterase family member 6-like n=1 Tax=Centruroides sculpturatus TaxID=218467 RepID=UPI000C6DCBAC|nr:ectonucleotide pyrophosphatase/phosphodiesterase family member 6-like [Centruroides sculpturatus]XP_023229035.1 ectonucleotide pyrophosphatase/phosphodiesterase family member 6-like [Centruroides sculpturatus]